MQNRSFELPPAKSDDMTSHYFVSVSRHVSCFKLGINETASIETRLCVCNDDFRGEDCGVPAGVWNTGDNAKRLHSSLKRRKAPRRIIHSLALNHEFDLFETRMALHYDVVDAFVLHEANVTNDGR